MGGRLVLVCLLVAGCSRARADVSRDFRLQSSAFDDGATIPVEHTCEADDLSPPLRWSGVPDDAEAFALVVEDDDHRVHWLVYDLFRSVRSLEVDASRLLSPQTARQGRNDFARVGYNGPCPGAGRRVEYHFRLLSLDAPTGLPAGADAAELAAAVEGHVTGRASLRGWFGHGRQPTRRGVKQGPVPK